MYKLFTITILTSFSIIRLCAQDDIESEMRNHPYFINNQNKIKDSFYQHTCKGAPYIALSDIDNLVIPGLFLSKLSSIINTDNCYIEIDSLVAYPIPRVEYEQNKYYNFMDICKDEKLLDDIYIWFDFKNINYLEAKIFIDYSVDIDLIEITVDGIMSELFPFFHCDDCIKYESVDIKKFVDRKGGNVTSIINPLNRDDIYDDSWAVIIGIDKYKYSKQLNYAVKDAEAVKELLISKFDYPEENIRYLTDKEATLSNIKFNLGEVATLAGENDRILVFYSGHGETLSGKDGTETGYIIPYEGKQNNPYATGLVMDEILRTCQMSNAKHMLFLMDACYSGLMTENMKGLSKPEERGYLNKVANESSRQIITAGGSDEQVIERDEWQHSAFTKNLIEGLDNWEADYNKDGCITADELSTYLRESVTEDSDFQQTPQDGRFKNSGGGEFVFFSDAINPIPSFDTNEEDIIYGCMDLEANNYNPNATNPDRSCQYGKLVTSLEFGEYEWKNNEKGKRYIETSIIINNNSNVAGYQFNIKGGRITNAWGGISEQNNFTISHSKDAILAFSFEKGNKLPIGGNQVLLHLNVQPKLLLNPFKTKVCLENIVLSDPKSVAIPTISGGDGTICLKIE